MDEKSLVIKPEQIRTMKKDIARSKGKGEQVPPAVSVSKKSEKAGKIKKLVPAILPAGKKESGEKKKKESRKGFWAGIFRQKLEKKTEIKPEEEDEEKKRTRPLYDIDSFDKEEFIPVAPVLEEAIPKELKKSKELEELEKDLKKEPESELEAGLKTEPEIKKKPKPEIKAEPEIKKETEKKIEEEIKKEMEKKLFIPESPTPPTPPTPPKSDKEFLLKEKEELTSQAAEIGRKIREISEEKKPFDVKKNSLLIEIEEIRKNFDIIFKKENKIEKQVSLIEKKEAAAQSSGARKKIEQKRWILEEKRRKIERQRWPWDEKLRKMEDKIKDVDSENAGLESREKKLKIEEKEILEKKSKIEIKIEKINLKENLENLDKTKGNLEKEKDEFKKRLNEVKGKLEDILLKEKEIEEDKKLIEEEEKEAKDFKERRKMEQERWEAEEKRRNIESKKWAIEEEENKLEHQHNIIEKKFQSISEKEINFKARIKEINQLLGLEAPESSNLPLAVSAEKEEIREKIVLEKIVPEKRESPVPPEKSLMVSDKSEEISASVVSKDERIEEAKRRIELLKKQREKPLVESLPKESPELPEFSEPSEKSELPEIGEISKKPELETAPPIPSFLKSPKELPVLEEFPRKPGAGGKFWVRVLIFILVLIILAIVASFWYWYLVIRKQPVSAPGTPPQEQAQQPPAETSEITVIPLFPVDGEIILEISSSQEISVLISQTLEDWQDINKFRQIIIKNTQEDKILDLKEILAALGVNLPEEFYQKTGERFTLFFYSQINGNRLGFVSEIEDKEGLTFFLRSKELSLKDDFSGFLNLAGPSGSPLVSSFRDASQVRGYSGSNFRYQTIFQEDLGICYLVSDNYFIFTSSWGSITKTLEKLNL